MKLLRDQHIGNTNSRIQLDTYICGAFMAISDTVPSSHYSVLSVVRSDKFPAFQGFPLAQRQHIAVFNSVELHLFNSLNWIYAPLNS